MALAVEQQANKDTVATVKTATQVLAVLKPQEAKLETAATQGKTEPSELVAMPISVPMPAVAAVVGMVAAVVPDAGAAAAAAAAHRTPILIFALM